jgi:hypothetical protein
MNVLYNKFLWNIEDRGQMTEATIQRLHGAPQNARVSRYTYEADDEIEGTSKKCTGYVFEGRFIFSNEEGAIELKKGDVFVFSGDYSIKVDKSAKVVVVWAWDFPPGFEGGTTGTPRNSLVHF